MLSLHSVCLDGERCTVQASSHVAINLRCTPNFNTEYPLVAFSFYESLPDQLQAASDLRFWLVAGFLGPSCLRVAVALENFLRRRYPQATIVRRFMAAENQTDEIAEGARILSRTPGGEEETEKDFALLALAPVLFRSPSSFSLWAGRFRTELALGESAIADY